MNKPQQSEENPYIATELTDIATSVTDRQKPSTVAVVFSVVLGLAVAVLVFGVSFFFTCLGTMSVTSLDNEFGMVFTFFVASLTAVAAFVFTVWGRLKILRALKK